MKLAKKECTILCEDVRHEVGGKFSLMGIFSKAIIIPDVPFLLPKICLTVMLENLMEDLPGFTVTLTLPEDRPHSLPYPAPRGAIKGNDANIVIGLSPVKINAFGPAKFAIRLKDAKADSIVRHFEIKKKPEN